MEERKGMLWYLANGAMELSWFLSWAMFGTLATQQRPFPFFETIVAFALAVALTRLTMGRGWRIVQVLGFQIAGFSAAGLLMIHRLYDIPLALTDIGWPAALLTGIKGPGEWFFLAMNLVLIAILWTGGVFLARRSRGYYPTCSRFDIGIAAFFGLFIVKLLLQVKGGLRIEDPFSLLFVFPFFLFGLLSVGMARIRGAATRAFLPGYRGIGLLMSFAAIVLLGAGGLVLFFLPGLTLAAEIGRHTIGMAGGPLLAVFVAVVRFVFGPRSIRTDAVAAQPSDLVDWRGLTPPAHDGWLGLIEKAVAWGMAGLMLLVLLAVTALIAFRVLQWLLSKTPADKRGKAPAGSLWRWLMVMDAFLVRLWKQLRHTLHGRRSGAELYGALLGWAGRSGIPCGRSETPLEFATRLMIRFPALQPQIGCLVGAFHREVYAEKTLSGAQIDEAKSAWRCLRSPAHWSARLRGWFVTPPAADDAAADQ